LICQLEFIPGFLSVFIDPEREGDVIFLDLPDVLMVILFVVFILAVIRIDADC